MAQHGFLEFELRPRIGQLRPSAFRLTCRHGNISPCYRLVSERLFGHLLRDDVAAGKRLLPPVGLPALRKDRLRLLNIGVGLPDVNLGDEHGGPCLGDLGFLLTGVETRQHLALGYAIAVIGIELDQRGPNLKSDLGEDTGLTVPRPKTRTTTSFSLEATRTSIGRFV